MSFLLANIHNSDSHILLKCHTSQATSPVPELSNICSESNILFNKNKLNSKNGKNIKNEYYNHKLNKFHSSSGQVGKENHYPLLTTESDSVMEFSILSTSRLYKGCNIQKAHCVVIDHEEHCIFHELNLKLREILDNSSIRHCDKDDFPSTVGLCLVPQIVKITQLLDYPCQKPQTEKETAIFLEMIIELFHHEWLPPLASTITLMNSAQWCLGNYDTQYNKVEIKKECLNEKIDAIVDKWSTLNYFPNIVISSLKFRIASKDLDDAICDTIAKLELLRNLIVTMVLEMSKTFVKIMTFVLELDIQEQFPNELVMLFIESFLDCTIECRTGEIMIGMQSFLETWLKRQPTYSAWYLDWCHTRLSKYNMQRNNAIKVNTTNDSDVTDDQELKFNKWEIGILFLRDIIEYIVSDSRGAHGSEEIGWLTIFQDESPADIPADTEVPGLDPHINEESTINFNTSRSPRKSKRAVIKEWSNSSKRKICEKYHCLVNVVEKRWHFRKHHIFIASVRYYNVNKPDTITPENLCHIQRVTQKLYKKEQRGKRKRDALKVILNITQ